MATTRQLPPLEAQSNSLPVVVDGQDVQDQIRLNTGGGGEKPQETGKGVVSYFIKDTDTKAPVETATIKVADRTISDSAMGTFVDLPAGDQEFTASAPGYQLSLGFVLVKPNESTHLDVNLTPAPDQPKSATGSIMIQVIDGVTKQPINDATVTLTGPGTYSASGSVVMFDKVTPGEYTYSAEAPKYMGRIDRCQVEAGGKLQFQVHLEMLIL